MPPGSRTGFDGLSRVRPRRPGVAFFRQRCWSSARQRPTLRIGRMSGRNPTWRFEMATAKKKPAKKAAKKAPKKK
jgi:hypothetical protein